MAWFAASILIAYRQSNADIDAKILVEEQVYLVEAENVDRARERATAVGAEIASLEDGLTINDRPATREFVGIRRIVTTQNAIGASDSRPGDLCEITYAQFLVNNEDDLNRLARESDVVLTYIGDY